MLTNRMQVQALADRLAQRQVPYTQDQFTGIIQSCWLIMDSLPPEKHVAGIASFLENHPEGRDLLKQLQQTKPGAVIGEMPNLEEMGKSIPPVGWLWKGWIPRGLISILVAGPGAGKTLVALDIARRIIHGEAFPDGAPVPKPGGSVLYVDAEATPQIIYQRARDWKLDMTRFFLKEPKRGGWIDYTKSHHRDDLIETIDFVKPEFVVIDSFANISTRGENDVEEVRELMQFFNDVAYDFSTGFTIIHHMRKVSFNSPFFEFQIVDARGSGYITHAGRTVMGLSVVRTSEKLDHNGPRRMVVGKSNCGIFPPALGFTLQPLGEEGVALQWGDEPQLYQEPTQIEVCKLWLSNLLQTAPGPIKSSEILRLAAEQGFNQRMVFRARLSLGSKVSFSLNKQAPDNSWFWTPE